MIPSRVVRAARGCGAALLVVLTLTASLRASAQSLHAGDPVRLLAPPTFLELTRARLEWLSGDSLRVRPNLYGAGPVTLPIARIQRLQVGVNAGRATGRGAVLGSPAGVALGLVLIAVSAGASEDTGGIVNGGSSVGAAMVGVVAGIGAGALLGSLHTGTTWTDVPRDSLHSIH